MTRGIQKNTMTLNPAIMFILISGAHKAAKWIADGVVLFRLPQGNLKYANFP